MIQSANSSLGKRIIIVSNNIRRFKTSDNGLGKSESVILEHNPNDIVSPFYIPTDLKMLQTYLKKFHLRSLLHGKGEFYVKDRDYDTLEVNGVKAATFKRLNFNDYYAVVNFAKWIADLQANSLKTNFVTLEKKLDDDEKNHNLFDLSANKFVGKVNLHPHTSVKLTGDVLESLIDTLTKENMIDNLYDMKSITEFFDLLISDKEFFYFNHKVVLQSLMKNLFVGLPDIFILETQFEKILLKFEEYGLDSSQEENILVFVDQFFDQLRRINVSKEPLSDSLMSSLFNFYTNTELYDNAFMILQQLLKENKCLPRSNHLLNYLTRIEDPLKLVGVVSMFQFNNIDNALFKCILNKVDCYEKIKFITSINPEDMFKDLSKLPSILTKLEVLNKEELDNGMMYNRYLSYYLREFDVLIKMKESETIDQQLLKQVVKSLYKVGNFYNVNLYLKLAQEKNILSDNLKNEIKQELSQIVVTSDTMSIEVLQNGFKELVDTKLR
ncbi:hypothetical protein QEN19_002337 [Hanseniaspora menglaensis]